MRSVTHTLFYDAAITVVEGEYKNTISLTDLISLLRRNIDRLTLDPNSREVKDIALLTSAALSTFGSRDIFDATIQTRLDHAPLEPVDRTEVDDYVFKALNDNLKDYLARLSSITDEVEEAKDLNTLKKDLSGDIDMLE